MDTFRDESYDDTEEQLKIENKGEENKTPPKQGGNCRMLYILRKYKEYGIIFRSYTDAGNPLEYGETMGIE